MTLRSAGDLDLLRHHPAGITPRVFVESGTFMGKTCRWALDRFEVVHTIELSPTLWQKAAAELEPLGATCHLGDTRDVLPKLATEITEPCVWFLDAHWLNQEHAAGKDTPLPLQDELRAIAERPYRDIVIVDDVASFGQEQYQSGWGVVSLPWIAQHFPGHSGARRHKDSVVVFR